jgi:hypothetical protein
MHIGGRIHEGLYVIVRAIHVITITTWRVHVSSPLEEEHKLQERGLSFFWRI